MNLLEVATDGSATNSMGMGTLLIMLVPVLLMFFFTSRSQKKREKAEQEMRDSVEVGDEITTLGGICGKVVIVKEDHLIIETGADRNRMQVTRWAIRMNNTAEARLQAQRDAAKAAADKAKAEKKSKKDKKAD